MNQLLSLSLIIQECKSFISNCVVPNLKSKYAVKQGLHLVLFLS